MTRKRLVLKAAFLYVAGFAFSMCTVLHGQTITGTWQGTLSTKESQRIVLKFVKSGNNGSLRGSLTFIDRGPSGPPLLSVTFAPPELSVTVADINYRGKLSADGRTITGVWTQGNQSSPLTLVLATPETLWSYSGPAPIPPMAVTADPSLDVATIKPSQGIRTGPMASKARVLQQKMRGSPISSNSLTRCAIARSMVGRRG